MTLKATNQGLTLVELMVTLIILVGLLTMAVPNFRTFIIDQRVKAATLDLMGTLRFARSEAVKRNGPVTVDAVTEGWIGGWAVHDDAGNVLMQHAPADDGIGITETGGATTLSFNGIGRLDSAASFVLCSRGNSEPVRRRRLLITSSGLPTTELTGTCGDES